MLKSTKETQEYCICQRVMAFYLRTYIYLFCFNWDGSCM